MNNLEGISSLRHFNDKIMGIVFRMKSGHAKPSYNSYWGISSDPLEREIISDTPAYAIEVESANDVELLAAK